MGLSFFAPLFLGGIGLLAVPWLVHQIRRPERETVLFGSLMFVPRGSRRIIERQSLQHILLMVLRMLCLLFLAFAFSRPYFSWQSPAQEMKESVRHLILVDVSASMGAGNRMESAKRHANRILDSLRPGESAALAVFDRQPKSLIPFGTPDGDPPSMRERLQREIAGFSAGYQSTAFLPALQTAQEILTANNSSTKNGNASPDRRLVLHFISDFQKKGMPEPSANWKLSPRIEFNPFDSGSALSIQFSLTDVSVRETPSREFLIVGQMRNESERSESRVVKLILDGAERDRRELTILPRQSSKVTFTIAQPRNRSFSGWLELESDDFLADNRRYFAWNPPQEKQVWLIAPQESGQNWPASWFVESALQTVSSGNWTVVKKTPPEFRQSWNETSQPDVLVFCGVGGWDRSINPPLFEFLRHGGGVLLMLDDSMGDTSPAVDMLQALGMQFAGFRNSDNRETIRETFAWIDFENPVFYPFRGSKYNDFTPIQFSNYVVLNQATANSERSDKAFSSVKTIARFDESHPAMMEAGYGSGRLLLWAFAPGLQWTNLPKSPRFVPLLVESVNELSEPPEPQPFFLVGDNLSESLQRIARSESWIASIPGEESYRTVDSNLVKNDPAVLRQPGILLGKQPENADWQWAYAVNMEKRESDLTPVSIDQFSNTLVSSLGEGIPTEREAPFRDRLQTVERENGHWFLLILLLGLLVETLYAAQLSRKTNTQESP